MMEPKKAGNLEILNSLTESSNHSPDGRATSIVMEANTPTPASDINAAAHQSPNEHIQEVDDSSSEGYFGGWATVVSG